MKNDQPDQQTLETKALVLILEMLANLTERDNHRSGQPIERRVKEARDLSHELKKYI